MNPPDVDTVYTEKVSADYEQVLVNMNRPVDRNEEYSGRKELYSVDPSLS